MVGTKLCREVELPGKGCGLVAVREIQPGELVARESPALVLPWWVRHSQYPARERREYLARNLLDLSPAQRRQFWALHDAKAGPGEGKTAEGIWRTNNFALGPSGPRCDNGLFLGISRFNHSCTPVAEFVWNSAVRQQEVRAVRAVAAGQELTISYFTQAVATLGRVARKQFLLRLGRPGRPGQSVLLHNTALLAARVQQTDNSDHTRCNK